MVQQLTIGSTALWAHGIEWRKPNDLDAFSPSVSEIEGRCHQLGPAFDVDPFWHESFAEWIPPGTDRYATLDELYTIKASHHGWELKNGSWNKHSHDLVMLKREGAKILDPLYSNLYKVWEGLHGKKVMNLDQDKTEFFDDAVRRTYDHDSLHESVAFGDRPVYESILKDGATVDVDSRTLWALDHESLVRLFTEEICVTALERIVVPKNYRCSPGAAYLWALRRTVTSLTKGKSSRFIIDNLETFMKPDPDYVKRHLANSDRLIKL
jgi:hypothetical protein